MNNVMNPSGQGSQQIPRPQQPQAQPAVMHAYEPQQQAQIHVPQDTTVSVRLDEDAIKILEQITPELREAFVTIAIKHFQYEPMFQHYFKKYIPQDTGMEPVPGQPAPMGSPMQGGMPGMGGMGSPSTQVPQAQAPQAGLAGGFDDWS